MSDMTYNGWTNYETWVVNLWMDNDAGSQEWLEEMAQSCIDDAEGDKDEAASDMAGRLESMHDDHAGELAATGVFADLIGHALGCVNWQEIAEHALEEIEYLNPNAGDEGDLAGDLECAP